MSRLNVTTICQLLTESALLLTFLLVPLILVPITSEVFEFNKLILVYLLSTIILTSESIRILSSDQPSLQLPPFYLTGAIFLLALILTTLTSQDIHVSLFGYYARFHGGLLSWISYTVIFLALIQQTPAFIRSTIKVSLFSGLLVSAWGFLEHWGIDASYWVQDVRYRVFSTLGQPNWLAAYLTMLTPFLFSFYLQARQRKVAVGLFLASLLFYTCFIFTYSRGGNIGLAAALLAWLILLGFTKIRQQKARLLLLTASLTAITILFASGLTPHLFGGAAPHRTVENLETGDQTARTRLIVWQGSLDIFFHHPLVGTGLETFGESFYQFRPAAMNEISDFDFLFNKAHNEYLNYLATTGLIGTIAYLALIASFFYPALKKWKHSHNILIISAISSMTGYLVQNAFGFTVVPLALLFILNLGVVISESPKIITWHWNAIFNKLRHWSILLLVPSLIVLLLITNIWRADIAYSQGLSTASADLQTRDFTLAAHLNPTEPLYYIELAFAKAQQAVTLPDSQTRRDDEALAVHYADQAITISPGERTLWRIRAQTLASLIPLDHKYYSPALAAYQKAVNLAPTDPRVRYELASFYLSQKEDSLALQTFQETLKLKSNFPEPYVALTHYYLDHGDKSQAKHYLDTLRHLDPQNTALISLEEELNQ